LVGFCKDKEKTEADRYRILLVFALDTWILKNLLDGTLVFRSWMDLRCYQSTSAAKLGPPALQGKSETALFTNHHFYWRPS
jgi:hypothetical protein